MLKLFLGEKDISDFLPSGHFCFLHNEIPTLPDWRRPAIFEPTQHHLNPVLNAGDYHYATYFVDVIDAMFSRGENTLTKDTGLDFILDRLLDKPKSLHDLIPPPDKKSTTGHVWAYNKINRILASPLLRKVFNPTANQFKLNNRTILAHLDPALLTDFDARLLGLLIIGQYQGQICLPNGGFFLKDTHINLIHQQRLIVGLNSLSEVPLSLQKALLAISDKTANNVLYDDALKLAQTECPFLPGTEGHSTYIQRVTGLIEDPA